MDDQRKIIEMIKKKETGCEVREDFLGKSEHMFLVSKMKESYEDPSTLHCRQKSRGETSDVMSMPKGDVKDAVGEFLKSKLRGDLPTNAKLDFTFHKNYTPYWLHTDAGYEEGEFIFKQGIIPLEINPEDSEVYTVIMNQRCYYSAGFSPDDGENIFDIADPGTMSLEEIERYWKPDKFKLKTLERYTIHTPFRWRLGDMAIWDRSMIHGSSDFDVGGTNYKIGLMWISSLR